MDPSNLFNSSLRPGDLSIPDIAARAILVYAALLVILRIGKKRSLSRATALDVVIVITIGSIAGRGITGNAPLLNCIAAVCCLMAVHWTISFVTRDNARLSAWVEGRPTSIIIDGRLDEEALRNAHMSKEDLREDLRRGGASDVSEVKLAVLERSGRLSVIKR